VFAVRFDGSHSADLQSFLCTADALSEARPSPDGRSAAFVREGALQVITLEAGGKPFNTSQPVVGSIAWEKAGKSVIFAAPTSKWEPGKNNLSTVTRIELAREAEEWKAAEPVKVAQICSSYLPRIRVLPDGSLIFASSEINFPSLQSSTPKSSFFTISESSGDKKPMRKIKSDAGQLPADLSNFAPSPDGKRLAVVDGEGDAVRVLTLETGSVETVWPKNRCKSRTAERRGCASGVDAVDRGGRGKGVQRPLGGGRSYPPAFRAASRVNSGEAPLPPLTGRVKAKKATRTVQVAQFMLHLPEHFSFLP
jgi:hypothetical protein